MATHTIHFHEPLGTECRGGAVTVGNFDGVHRGHQALLAELRRQAAAVRGPAVAVTFDPHPLRLLRPEQFQPTLTTVADRAELLQRYGADQVVILRTTPELLHLSAREFFDQVIRGRLDARAVVPGFNFGFGHNREGNAETLAAFCRAAGLECALVPPLEVEGRPVSTSRVKDELRRGDVRQAAVLLGRPYRLHGVVGTGKRRGQALGFPTANLEGIETLLPADGVYAGLAQTASGAWPTAVNLGPNPTFGEEARKVEAHLIGFQGELYGQGMALDFAQRLRDTRAFAGPDELVRQLRADVAAAARIVTQGPGQK
jgi:riboflavin kinase/FMN adenylyltransferase